MEAYGQFAWKLRHYRRGPPESNHSSNGPVCRHLGGRETRRNTLLLISLSPSLPFAPASLPLVLVLSSSPARFRFLLHRRPVLSSAADCSDYAQVSPPDHCSFIGTSRTGRSDLGAVQLIGVNDHGAVSPIVELNGKADSLASRAPYG